MEDSKNDVRVEGEGNHSIQMPFGKKLVSIRGIDVCEKDAGNALQLLEFCFVFRKVLNIRKGHGEHILQDLLHGRFSRHRRLSAVSRFIVCLLSLMQDKEQVHQDDETPSPSLITGSWFGDAKKILSKYQKFYAAPLDLNGLESAAQFEKLDPSVKLRILNLLCDEVLETKMVRNWMDEQNRDHARMIKETKQKLVDAKDKEKILTKKTRDANAGGKSIALESELAQAHMDVLSLRAVLSDSK
ncbi:hypothetical protein M569_07080 [Genlisea aurea]|uniref:WHIM1 domain-containing protein n=1 Tax=Genlisea aurea TaxID=192259 RepID=S8DWT5_9LAMI|nr:hypothetical protein M569_07080 [Genlisea aurea]